MAAVQRGDAAAVAVALAAGLRDRAWVEGINDAVHVACKHGRHDCLRLLLEAGADPNALSYRGSEYHEWSLRPIHKAVQAGHLNCVAALLNAGADPCDTSAGCTPLHLGIGNTEAVRLLLSAAPQTAMLPDSSGRTPLHLGIGNTEAVRLLLRAAPQTATMRDSRSFTPLDAAIGATSGRSASGDSVQLLLAEADLQPTNEITDRLIKTLVVLDMVGDHEGLRRLAPAVPVFMARLGLSLDSGNGYYTFERFRSHMDSSALARWLPAMLRRSDAAAARLVPFLPLADRERLRTLALCLVRYQHSLSSRLPAPVAGRLLALAAAQHALRVEQQQRNAARHAKIVTCLRLCWPF